MTERYVEISGLTCKKRYQLSYTTTIILAETDDETTRRQLCNSACLFVCPHRDSCKGKELDYVSTPATKEEFEEHQKTELQKFLNSL